MTDNKPHPTNISTLTSKESSKTETKTEKTGKGFVTSSQPQSSDWDRVNPNSWDDVELMRIEEDKREADRLGLLYRKTDPLSDLSDKEDLYVNPITGTHLKPRERKTPKEAKPLVERQNPMEMHPKNATYDLFNDSSVVLKVIRVARPWVQSTRPVASKRPWVRASYVAKVERSEEIWHASEEHEVKPLQLGSFLPGIAEALQTMVQGEIVEVRLTKDKAAKLTRRSVPLPRLPSTCTHSPSTSSEDDEVRGNSESSDSSEDGRRRKLKREVKRKRREKREEVDEEARWWQPVYPSGPVTAIVKLHHVAYDVPLFTSASSIPSLPTYTSLTPLTSTSFARQRSSTSVDPQFVGLRELRPRNTVDKIEPLSEVTMRYRLVKRREGREDQVIEDLTLTSTSPNSSPSHDITSTEHSGGTGSGTERNTGIPAERNTGTPAERNTGTPAERNTGTPADIPVPLTVTMDEDQLPPGLELALSRHFGEHSLLHVTLGCEAFGVDEGEEVKEVDDRVSDCESKDGSRCTTGAGSESYIPLFKRRPQWRCKGDRNKDIFVFENLEIIKVKQFPEPRCVDDKGKMEQAAELREMGKTWMARGRPAKARQRYEQALLAVTAVTYQDAPSIVPVQARQQTQETEEVWVSGTKETQPSYPRGADGAHSKQSLVPVSTDLPGEGVAIQPAALSGVTKAEVKEVQRALTLNLARVCLCMYRTVRPSVESRWGNIREDEGRGMGLFVGTGIRRFYPEAQLFKIEELSKDAVDFSTWGKNTSLPNTHQLATAYYLLAKSLRYHCHNQIYNKTHPTPIPSGPSECHYIRWLIQDREKVSPEVIKPVIDQTSPTSPDLILAEALTRIEEAHTISVGLAECQADAIVKAIGCERRAITQLKHQVEKDGTGSLQMFAKNVLSSRHSIWSEDLKFWEREEQR
eukprot:GHVN01040799.1.p1 GENE.GHVN01040799.1~~GHVN01040799.1.p1  ORF type:complete len:921 (+),score=231.18 GHVN01040799.1:141-2903(+)